MTDICQVCGNTKKIIPAGVSKKTGKPYQAFSICENCNPRGSKKPDNTELLNRTFKGVQAIYKELEVIKTFLLEEKQSQFEKELEEPEEEAEKIKDETAYKEEVKPEDIPF